MGTVRAIFKREFRSFFTTSMGYVILVVFLVLLLTGRRTPPL